MSQILVLNRTIKLYRSQGISTIRNDYDEYGAELEPEARVWKTYVREADRFDAEKVEEWNKCVVSGQVITR